MYTLTDSFNRRAISRHRTLLAAVKAKQAHIHAFQRRNGSDSYLTYEITDDKGERVPTCDVHTAEHQLERLR
jgi:hypothetical protein